MAQSFKETAHLKNDPEKIRDNWTHVFDRKNCRCHDCMDENLACTICGSHIDDNCCGCHDKDNVG